MTLRRTLLLVAALASGAAQAQISTERPGLGSSTATVGARAFQVEVGAPEAVLDADDSFSVPVMLRYGVTPDFEVRVAASALDGASDGDGLDAEFGLRTVTAGVKFAVPTRALDLAVIPEFVVPTEGGGDLTFQLNLPAGLPVGDFGLTVIPGLVTGGGSTQLNAVAVLSRAFGGTLSGYAEAGAFPLLEGDGDTPVVLGAGLAALLNEDVQVDAFFDAGVTDAAPELVVGVGVSFRID